MMSGDTFQISFYVGTNIQNMLYGMELVFYFKTIYIILSKRRARKKSDIFYGLFSSMMVFSITLWVATQAWIGQEMWLLNPDYPGGPNGYWQNNFADWYMDWGTAAVILLQLMTDALMMHRCRIVWNSYCVIIVPIILWLATLVLGILVVWTSSAGGNFFGSSVTSEIGLAYYTISVFLNATLTCVICYRIMRYGQKVQEHLGREHASLYFTATTMVIESVLPYTISGIAFLVSFGIGSPTSVAFISVYMLMMCISPQVLILRVIVGTAWDNNTSKTQNSTIKFDLRRQRGMEGTQQTDSTGTRVDLPALSNVHFAGGRDEV